MPQNSQLQPQTVIGANGKIAQVTVQNKNVQIIHSQNQQPQQQVFTSTAGQAQIIHNQQNVMNQQIQQGNGILNNVKSMNDSQQLTNNNNNQQQQVVVNSNVLKFVELPKVQPNQQLFSLNTISNEITQLNPNQTTAALGPMERLLIVPSGINAQQLAQCLSQGQIHFNNIGQVNPTTDPNKIQQQMQIQQQIQQQQMQLAIQQQNLQAKQTKPVVTLKETKPRKGKAKKTKDEQKVIKPNSVKQNNVIHPVPMMNKALDTKVAKVMSSPPALVSTSCSSTTTSLVNSKNTITISPTTSTLVPIQKQTKGQATKPLPTLNPTKITTMHPKNNNNKVVMNNNSVQNPPQSQLMKPQTPNKQLPTSNQIMAQQQQLSPISAPLPPLISVNTAPMPRVQTIQLTPQKQQSLKNVQMQIQQLSAKLKNKSLLATLTADVDPNNPIHNNPLPILTNINNMSDSEIYNALQRLFVEQQKILATGKIIPTIPTAVSPRAIHMSATSTQGQSNSQSTQSTPVSQGLPNNVQTIFAPKMNSTATNSNNVIFAGNKLQSNTPSVSVPAAPTVKQENIPMTPTTLISSSLPPPLVMPIKMENLMSPSNSSTSMLSPPVCSTASSVIGSTLVTQGPQYQDIKSNNFVEIKSEFVPPLVASSPPKLAQIEADIKMKVTRSSL